LFDFPNFGVELWSAESLEPKSGRVFQPFFSSFYFFRMAPQTSTLNFLSVESLEPKSGRIFFSFFFFLFSFELWNAKSLEQKSGRIFFKTKFLSFHLVLQTLALNFGVPKVWNQN
jgi:hypothetical protein